LLSVGFRLQILQGMKQDQDCTSQICDLKSKLDNRKSKLIQIFLTL